MRKISAKTKKSQSRAPVRQQSRWCVCDSDLSGRQRLTHVDEEGDDVSQTEDLYAHTHTLERGRRTLLLTQRMKRTMKTNRKRSTGVHASAILACLLCLL
jgi:hypothetical protein